MEEEIYDSEYDDSMDGDHDSCMNSIGWGEMMMLMVPIMRKTTEIKA